MKKYILKITTILLFLTVFSSCKKIELVPIFPSDEIFAFFEEYLPMVSDGYISECFFTDDKKDDKCIIINSMNELEKNFFCSSTILPNIDFKSYTLIIGRYPMFGEYRVIKQNINIIGLSAKLNITVECPEGSYFIYRPLYYWGLYPKIHNTSISVTIIYQKGGICI